MGRLGDLTEAQTPGPARPRVRLGRARHLPDPAAAVHGRGAARVQGARRGVGGRPPRRPQDRRGGPRAAPARQGRPRRSPSRCASSSRRSTTASAAVEPDRRAAASGPPAGDKTHTTSSRAGFTGMEAIWNFFYWQTLSTNALDDVGHVLRLTALVNQCSTYQIKPDEAHDREVQPVPRPDAARRDDAGSDRERCRGRPPRRPARAARRRPARRPRLGRTRPARTRRARRRARAPPAATDDNPALDFLLGE